MITFWKISEKNWAWSNLMQLSLVHNVSLHKTSKCQLILDSLFINAPVAALYSNPKPVIVVSSAHIQINIARQSSARCLAMMLKIYKSKWVWKSKACQHSVHPTGGSRRVFRQFSRLEVSSGKMALSCPAHQRVTQAVGRPSARDSLIIWAFVLIRKGYRHE